jgi:hypothetical protein
VHQLMSEAGPLIKGGEKGAVKLVGNPLALFAHLYMSSSHDCTAFGEVGDAKNV